MVFLCASAATSSEKAQSLAMKKDAEEKKRRPVWNSNSLLLTVLFCSYSILLSHSVALCIFSNFLTLLLSPTWFPLLSYFRFPLVSK